jgi:hypothetical protein
LRTIGDQKEYESMILPDYWLPRPVLPEERAYREDFNRLWMDILAKGENTWIEYNLPAPKWSFLSHLADHHGLALHGSGNPDITLFEPRQPVDLGEFGNQKAVFAAGDGIWAMFYAIVDRNRYKMSINNACIRLVDPAQQTLDSYYLFSVSRDALVNRPWRTGTVYILPRETFIVQPPFMFGEFEILIPQLASPVPVAPLARLLVEPDDFPFLNQIRGHDHSRLQEYADAMQTGGPWPE